MKTTIEILREARALIAKGRTQKHLATDAFGRKVLPWEPGAACWCSYGAIVLAVGENNSGLASACVALREAIGGEIVPWNDAKERTQPEVIAMFDRAIAAQEAAQ